MLDMVGEPEKNQSNSKSFPVEFSFGREFAILPV